MQLPTWLSWALWSKVTHVRWCKTCYQLVSQFISFEKEVNQNVFFLFQVSVKTSRSRCRYNAVTFLINIHKKTSHSSPVRASYGVSFVDQASDWYPASVPLIIYITSYNIGMCYNGTRLYSTSLVLCAGKPLAGIISCMRPASEIWRYIVMSSLIDWAHTQNDPCTGSWWIDYLKEQWWRALMGFLLSTWKSFLKNVWLAGEKKFP